MAYQIQQIELDVYAGDSIYYLAKKAKRIAEHYNVASYVYFLGNDTLVRVNQQTNIDLLLRDYEYADYLGFTSVGPYCEPHLPEALVQRIRSAEKEIKQLRQKIAEEISFQNQQKEMEYEILTSKTPFSFRGYNAKVMFQDWRDHPVEGGKTYPEIKNGLLLDSSSYIGRNKQLDYHQACFDFAVRWAKAMAALSTQKNTWIGPVAREASHLADNGMTGFQVSAAKIILKNVWFYSEVFKRAEQQKFI